MTNIGKYEIRVRKMGWEPRLWVGDALHTFDWFLRGEWRRA